MRIIDADEVKKRFPIMENDFGVVINERLHKHLDEIPTVDAIPKADYENRLKADMVIMLEDLDLQIDELAAYNREYAKIQRLIRDKINALRGEEDGNKND